MSDSESNQQSDGRELRLLQPGEIFGNYRVIRCLCDGLVAAYYHMQHVRDMQDVTIGIFHHRAAHDDEFKERLEKLKARLETFNHEGIPKIRDCMEIDELTCIRLDPVEGQTLSSYFSRRAVPGESGLDEEKAALILAQILGVLGYAHSQGVDHRDLDSNLILVRDDGSVSILGLGVKATLEIELFESIVSASVSPLTSQRKDDRLSSFDVMSPEYKSGTFEDARVDIYCAAIVGYWLLTGQKPVLSHYEAPSQKIPDLPRKWDDYFKNSLERKTEKRYQSCRIALEALKQTEDASDSDRSGFIQRQIDRIPVPKQIKERGQTATRIYRLSVIGLLGLGLVAFAAFFVHVTFLEERGYSKDVAQRVVEGKMPHLRFKLSPPVAKVEFDGFQESFIANDGQLELMVQPGDYVLRMSAPNHTTAVLRVNIERKQDYTRDLRVNLEPEWAEVKIVSAPEAKVTLIGANDQLFEIGQTDKTGVLNIAKGVVSGTYTVRAEREGYEPGILEAQEIKFGELTEIEMPLVPLPASLTIRTEPEGAMISFGGIDVGETPLTLEGIDPVETYDVVAALPGYREIQWQLKVQPGASTEVDLGQLELRSASLDISASFSQVGDVKESELLEQVEILVGDLRFPYGDPGLNTVPEGEQVIRAVHPEYASKAVKVNLQDGDEKAFQFDLVPRPGLVEMTLPEGIKPEILLNGKAVNLRGDILPIPAKRTVKVELRIPDYLTMVREFALKPNERVSWNVEPVRLPGPSLDEDWTLPYLGIRFAWIPAGEFTMGAPKTEQGRLPNEGDRTKVTLTKGFWAGIYEVSQAEYLAVIGKNPSEFKGKDRPVDSVLWADAVAFCEALTSKERAAGRLPEGFAYRLPTEAEWEYAARAGSITPFHFGAIADTKDGNFQGFYPRDREDVPDTAETYGTLPVGQYKPNTYGLYDVHGNVGEWSLESYNGRLSGGSVVDPDPRTGGTRATVRGGTWENSAVLVRVTVREDVGKRTQSNAIGFRVFLAPEK